MWQYLSFIRGAILPIEGLGQGLWKVGREGDLELEELALECNSFMWLGQVTLSGCLTGLS